MHYTIRLGMLFVFAVLLGAFPPPSAQSASAATKDTMNGESALDQGEADVRIVYNFIFWCEYSYDNSKVAKSHINGIEGMSDHGYTHVLKAGGAISVFTEYAVAENPREDFLDAVRGCEKIPGSGLFRHLYMCEDKITGIIATDLGLYTVTYRKESARTDWRWDWDAFRLILETFRLVEGSEFKALYRALYPGIASPYENTGPHGKVETW